MIALGGALLQFIRARDFRYYRYTIVARIFIVVAMSGVPLSDRLTSGRDDLQTNSSAGNSLPEFRRCAIRSSAFTFDSE
jgi:hypothetical protein